MAAVPIDVAFWDYDRTAPLVDGRAAIKGFAPRFSLLRPQETFVRAFRSAEFDICELSLSRHAQAVARGDSRYVGLPIFLSRCFRHASIYVRADISTPERLKGKRIGLGNYDDTAAVVVRAILREVYGVDARDVRWVVGDVEAPFRTDIPLQQPAGFDVSRANGLSLDDMLVAGDLDALIALMPPPSFRSGDSRVRRLFPDWRAAEESWFARQRIFPIMHLVGVRDDLVQRHPGVIQAAYDAFALGGQIARENLQVLQASKTMLPWLVDEHERTKATLGEDFWPYGVTPNRHVLDWTLRNLLQDRLLSRPVNVEELFAPDFV
jgi:4,5-dihydroxyphthalate decarboxylase